MTDNQLVATTIIGVFAPWAIAAIQRRGWSDEVRYIVAFIAYLVISAFVTIWDGGIDVEGFGWRDYFKVAAVMVITGQSSFKLIWSRTVTPIIEDKTTPGPATT